MRNIKGYEVLEIMRNTPFTVSHLILTEDCNLRCKYCYENANRCKNNYMSFDTAKKSADFLFDNALKYGAKELTWKFFGGEPLLNLDVMIKIFRYAVDKANQYHIKLSFILITNGTMYNKQFEEFILEYCKAGNVIVFSIDGIPEVQDKNRITANGKPTSGIVVENILKLKTLFEKNQIESGSINTHSVVTKDNISKMFLSYKYFQHLGIDSTRFDLSYDEAWNENDISIYIEQLSLIADSVYEECIALGSLTPYEKAFVINGLKPVCSSEITCDAARSLCTIIPNGDIYPCQRAYFYNPGLKLGNVFDGIIDNNIRKLFFDACRSDMHVDNINCGKCDNTDCRICILLNYGKRNDVLKCSRVSCAIYKAKWDFIIETKKRFYKLFNKHNYNKCNEMTFFKAANK